MKNVAFEFNTNRFVLMVLLFLIVRELVTEKLVIIKQLLTF